jgi:hypothetical protein
MPGKSPIAARITARFWRQHDDGDADSDGGTECHLLEDRRDANKLAGLVARLSQARTGCSVVAFARKGQAQGRARFGDMRVFPTYLQAGCAYRPY